MVPTPLLSRFAGIKNFSNATLIFTYIPMERKSKWFFEEPPYLPFKPRPHGKAPYYWFKVSLRHCVQVMPNPLLGQFHNDKTVPLNEYSIHFSQSPLQPEGFICINEVSIFF